MYKERQGQDKEFDSAVSWLRQTMDTQKDLDDDPKEFYKSLKIDLYSGQIFTFTPKGDVIVLPTGATPVDFAYKVHVEVGNKCCGAKINGRIVPLDTRLKTGEYVEILVNRGSKGPKRDWLNFVVSGTAKSRIRAFFRKEAEKEAEAARTSGDSRKKEPEPQRPRLELIITAADSKGLLNNITGAISALRLSIKQMNAVEKNHQAIITVDIEMRKGMETDTVIKQLRQVKGVKTVFSARKDK